MKKSRVKEEANRFMRPKPIEVKALEHYRIWIKYSDGKEGEIDLSGYAGKGKFERWKDYSFFRSVSLGEHGEIAWGEDIDLCPDKLYLTLTNKKPEELFPNLKKEIINA